MLISFLGNLYVLPTLVTFTTVKSFGDFSTNLSSLFIQTLSLQYAVANSSSLDALIWISCSALLKLNLYHPPVYTFAESAHVSHHIINPARIGTTCEKVSLHNRVIHVFRFFLDLTIVERKNIFFFFYHSCIKSLPYENRCF
nr:MAG TPA: hypothetical protein [Caudoviricetes sp.]